VERGVLDRRQLDMHGSFEKGEVGRSRDPRPEPAGRGGRDRRTGAPDHQRAHHDGQYRADRGEPVV
jgi:hypothetical protein